MSRGRSVGIYAFGALLATILLWETQTWAERLQYQVGGQGGVAWSALTHQAIALDDTSFSGSIQPKELRPWENIMVGPEERANIFGYQWQQGKFGGEAFGLQIGLNPRFWRGSSATAEPEMIDGDAATSNRFRILVPGEELAQYASVTSGAGSAGAFIYTREGYTFDLAFPMPVNRIVFFPPQQGISPLSTPYRDTAPQGFAVSVARTPEDFLIKGHEPYPLRTLETLVERTLANSRSVVDLSLPLQPVRFIRLDVSLMPQVYSVAEFQVFGEGVVPSTTYTSSALDFGESVNFGRIDYVYRVWRRSPEGELVEDPEGVARLIIETRTGADDTPLAYLVVDDFGGTKEVSQKEYNSAALPRRENTNIRYPGQKSGIVEDRTYWSPWSSPYEQSGLQNRSPDGRQYLQFRFAVETGDVLSIGRIDSLIFEYSPLLVASVTGEVSLADRVEETPGDIEDGSEHPLEVQAGDEQLLVYDIAASFDAPSQKGYDGVRLDVPTGTRFLRLETGDPLVEIGPDSTHVGDDELVVYFPSNRITAENNRPVRLTLETTILNSSTFFTGDLFDTESDNLPQSIDAGNVRDDMPTNSLRVLALQERLRFLKDVELTSPVVTPNADGINDRVGIAFDVLFVETAQVKVDILDLAGRRIRRLLEDERRRGHYVEWWNGTDESGKTVAPGIYLCHIEVETQSEDAQITKAVSVVY